MELCNIRFRGVEGKYIYFDADGNKVTGWQTIENALYCFDEKGIMQKSGWITTDDGRAYLSDDGKALSGWQTIDGKEYYFDSKGIAATGELKLGLEKCKFSESGELLSKEKTEIDPGKPMVALTFDDGPGPRTSEILDQLKKYNAHATFFMLGKNVKSYPDAIKQMLKDGNELGNHSYDHQQLTKIDAEAIAKEVNDTNENIKNICGSPATVLRPPYGAINDTVKSSVGMPMILWNVDTLDWKTRNTQSTIDEVMRNLKDGDIILMHDIHEPSVQAALKLIPDLVSQGYKLMTVSELAAAKNVTLQNTTYSQFWDSQLQAGTVPGYNGNTDSTDGSDASDGSESSADTESTDDSSTDSTDVSDGSSSDGDSSDGSSDSSSGDSGGDGSSGDGSDSEDYDSGDDSSSYDDSGDSGDSGYDDSGDYYDEDSGDDSYDTY